MELELSVVEARVVGALMEKERATPQNYPLSLNATLNACNQKSNRHPVMALEETTVFRALEQLMAKGVVQRLVSDDARVPKYRQTFTDAVGLDDREAAAVCVLVLRGPQTPGEIRGRTERLCKFESLDEATETIYRLLNREPEPYVQQLPRQPGTKESRYAHLFSGESRGGTHRGGRAGGGDGPGGEREDGSAGRGGPNSAGRDGNGEGTV